MKKVFIALLVSFVIFSCAENKMDKLKGSWVNVATRVHPILKDSLRKISYIEHTDSGIYVLSNSDNSSTWYYNWNGEMDSISLSSINFNSKNQFVIAFPDSILKEFGYIELPTFNRIDKVLRPNKMIYELFDSFKDYGSSMDIDTLGDGTIYYNLELDETPNKTILTIEHEVKYFIDKQMKALPLKEKLSKYSSFESAMFNEYTWEDLSNKILMECYFKHSDTTDEYAFNDNSSVEVKIWQNVK